jgi:hypothetical protein
MVIKNTETKMIINYTRGGSRACENRCKEESKTSLQLFKKMNLNMPPE